MQAQYDNVIINGSAHGHVVGCMLPRSQNCHVGVATCAGKMSGTESVEFIISFCEDDLDSELATQ